MRVFISYRREDSADTTGRIDDRLVTAFGRRNVYKDVDSIPLGVDFRDQIRHEVGRCDVLLVVIGEGWLWSVGGSGRRRLEDRTDWVRVEIEAALERKIPVIPILLGATEMPRPEELPESLKELAFRNATRVGPDPDFHRDLDRLIKALKRYSPKRSKVEIKEKAGRPMPLRRIVGSAMALLILVSILLGVRF